ncbi:MAG: cation:proton antiporter [Paludibacter sp.]|nr:cation:proton antiporter [Paludibacter sp.]
MKGYKYILFYVTIISIVTIALFYIISGGSKLENELEVAALNIKYDNLGDFFSIIKANLQHPLSILLVQIVVIIFVARIVSWLFKKIGQPVVIGEIIAGIILGPSLLGLYYPEISDMIFPIKSLDNLHFVSQIGLVLFMFTVGLELDLSVLKSKAKEAIVIGHASAVFPFVAGLLLAYYLYPLFAPVNVTFVSFALFFSISMSISAFPVLARIAQERAIHKTKTGTIVMACAASNDLLVWSLLAVIISIVRSGSFLSATYTIIFGLIYIFLMIKFVRPFLQRIGELHPSKENLSKPIVAIFFTVLILSAFISEVIGIHALFGAFLAGAIMPDNLKFRNLFIEKVEDVSIVLLLPLFFVFTGLRTQIGLIDDPQLWKTAGLIVLIAISGKLIGVTLVAKIFGQNWKDSLILGTLLNTRGLMVLIILNIGYDLGVFSSEIFTMLVLMALATTLMTAPLLTLINKIFDSGSSQTVNEISRSSKYNILISFANPEMGKSLLRLANGFVKELHENATVTVMHLAESNETHQYNIEQYETESFESIVDESGILNQKISTLFKASGDIVTEITEIANKGNYDLLLIGIGKSIFEGNLLGKMLGFTTRIINPDRLINQVVGKENLFGNIAFDYNTQLILSKSDISVGILIDKGLRNVNLIIVPILSEKDLTILKYTQKLIKNSKAQITFVDLSGFLENNIHLKESIKHIEQIAPNHVYYIKVSAIPLELLSKQNLMIISDTSWKKAVEQKYEWLEYIPSTLIISDKTNENY